MPQTTADIPVPPAMEEKAAVVHRDEAVEAVRSIPHERVQQHSAEQSLPRPREETVEAVRSIPRERVQQYIADQICHAPQGPEETVEVVTSTLS